MDSQAYKLALYGAGAAALAVALRKAKTRIDLSRAKHRSIAGHSKMSRRVAKLIPFYEFTGGEFFRSDEAPSQIGAIRKASFDRLASDYNARYAKTIAAKADVKDGISDMQFTDAYRVPFPYSRVVRDNLGGSPFLASSSGVTVTDIDGNCYYDVAGSYGVNVFGYDFYKECLERGADRVKALGPVLGAYHPIIAYNVRRLKEISGLDEVSFHMSGTEAVMQAVRLARYHTGRSHVVRFCGAYHGWWGDVQPGVGNPTPARDTYTLADMSEKTLHVLRTRADIACVLINPVQAMHPNMAAPGDSALIDSTRSATYDRAAYTAWLRRLRDVCTERGIIMILDEIFVGFRLAAKGAQEYFVIHADMVTYGKTLGGGLPIGVLCGRHELMKRYRDDRPADICFARGTFNSHPYVMGAAAEFLVRMEQPQYLTLYRDLDATWTARAAQLNKRLADRGLPVEVVNMSTIFIVTYKRPSRYNWMLQFYLRKHGLALSWVGTGRMIFSLNYTAEDFEAVADRLVKACAEMEADGWWWEDAEAGSSREPIRRRVLREMWNFGYLGRKPKMSTV